MLHYNQALPRKRSGRWRDLHRIQDDLGHGLKELLPITGHVQVASAPLRQEPGAAEIDALQLLDELGYDGWVGCEYKPANGTLAGLDWIASV